MTVTVHSTSDEPKVFKDVEVEFGKLEDNIGMGINILDDDVTKYIYNLGDDFVYISIQRSLKFKQKED